MARALFTIEKGLRILAENSNTDGVDLLFGSAIPGSQAQENDATVGSIYLQTSNGTIHTKITAGSGTDKWSQQASQGLVTFRGETIEVATNDPIPGGGITDFSDDEGTLATEYKFDLSSDSAHQDIQFAGAVTGATATGLSNDATVYTMSVSVNKVPQAISVVGSAAQTLTTLLAEINADLTGVTATFDDPNDLFKIDHDTTGSGNTIEITDTDLISSLTAGGGAALSVRYLALSSGDFVLFDSDASSGGAAIYKVDVVTDGVSTTFTNTAVTALSNNDTFVVVAYLPDTLDAQEKQAIVIYNGSAIVKISDFNWNFADGIGLASGYTAGTGNVTASDTVQTALQKLDGNIDAIDSREGLAQGATNFGTFTPAGIILPASSTAKAIFQSISNEISTYGSGSGITAITTIDSVLVDNYKAVEWWLWAALDSDPTRVRMLKIMATHNGHSGADAASSDQNVSGILRIGANFTVNVTIDLSGVTTAQVMRLRVDASSAVTVASYRRHIL